VTGFPEFPNTRGEFPFCMLEEGNLREVT
jgi:hypothetical protein